jgi:hypothetical protein
MSAVVEGTQAPISELTGLTDWVAVKKVGVNLVRASDVHSFHAPTVQQIKWRPRYQGKPE